MARGSGVRMSSVIHQTVGRRDLMPPLYTIGLTRRRIAKPREAR
jgi:hypothetical protein